MKRFALLLASAAFATPAFAADVIWDEPAAPAAAPIVFDPGFTWTGFYAGAQAGAAFNRDSGPFQAPNSTFSGGSNNGDSGFIGGVHVGYDWQFDNFVVGAVADINYIDASSVSTFPVAGAVGGVPGDFVFGATSDIDFVGTVRARAGLAADRFLVYATGGLAYASLDTSAVGPATFTATAATPAATNLTPGAYDVTYSNDNDDVGYAVGAGVDYLVTQNLSIGVEYLYTDLGSETSTVTFTPTAGGAATTATTSNDLDFHTVWAKASFRFN